jgi:hypothetical protein
VIDKQGAFALPNNKDPGINLNKINTVKNKNKKPKNALEETGGKSFLLMTIFFGDDFNMNVYILNFFSNSAQRTCTA